MAIKVRFTLTCNATGGGTMEAMKLENPATIETLLQMPKDGRKHELVDGKIVVSPTGMRHSAVGLKIAAALLQFVRQHGLGEVYMADVGIILPDGNVRSPDATFVSLAKLPEGQSPEGYGALVPDLVVEVLSPNDSLKFVGEKIGEYFDNGVPLVWLVDPNRKTVTVYRSLIETRQLTSEDTITAEPILPGFSCSVAQFF